MLRTRALLAVAEVLIRDPDGRHYQRDLAARAGVQPGSLVAILGRLREAQWIADDGTEPGLAGKHRHYFRLTPLGKLALTAMVTKDQERRAKLAKAAG